MLTIVIPTYKEAKNLDVLLPQIYKTLSPVYPDLKILLVDDASNDGIEEVVWRHNQACGGSIILNIRKKNKGLASAWQDGIMNSTTPLIGIMDADLAHDPRDMLRMAEKLISADMVIGSRYLPGHVAVMEGKSPLATYLSEIGQGLGRLILGLRIYDMSHSLRVFRREVSKKVLPLLTCNGNAMMVEFTFHTQQQGFRIAEIPVTYGKRLHGETKLGVVKEGLKFLKILWRLKTTSSPK